VNKLFIIDLMPFLYKGHFVILRNPRMTARGRAAHAAWDVEGDFCAHRFVQRPALA